MTAQDRFTRDGLETAGWEGFQTMAEMRRNRLRDVPCLPGVYAILCEADYRPGFRRASCGGWFKCQDPTVPLVALRSKWIDGAQTLYIGRAAGGAASKRHLSMRLGQLLAFGAGLPIDHRGGRYLWQLVGSERLVLCWKTTTSAVATETRLIDQFVRAYGALPFANLRR